MCRLDWYRIGCSVNHVVVSDLVDAFCKKSTHGFPLAIGFTCAVLPRSSWAMWNFLCWTCCSTRPELPRNHFPYEGLVHSILSTCEAKLGFLRWWDFQRFFDIFVQSQRNWSNFMSISFEHGLKSQEYIWGLEIKFYVHFLGCKIPQSTVVTFAMPCLSEWCFQLFFCFYPNLGKNGPIWPIFFNCVVSTTN